MTGFEPRISGVWSDRSTNWATTTAHGFLLLREIETQLTHYDLDLIEANRLVESEHFTWLFDYVIFISDANLVKVLILVVSWKTGPTSPPG